jgi:GDP-D-mannose dehydratase
MTKKALISGITGQDGSYLAELLLEAIRHADWPVRFYEAGSSEMFGKVSESPQSERTPFYPLDTSRARECFGFTARAEREDEIRKSSDAYRSEGDLGRKASDAPTSTA